MGGVFSESYVEDVIAVMTMLNVPVGKLESHKCIPKWIAKIIMNGINEHVIKKQSICECQSDETLESHLQLTII